jgi:DNA repair photolyase
VKFQAAQALADQIRPGLLRGRPVAMGTATDPYQPAEKRFQVTRRLLESLERCSDLDLSITTKSPLILRDVDLLQKIARTAVRLRVNVSLITTNPSLARVIDRHAPAPTHRIDTIRSLTAAGIPTGIFVMPILPGITDSEGEIRAVLGAAKRAGADQCAGDIVRLIGSVWDFFDPVLRKHFPHLVALYRELRTNGGTFPSSIAAPIRSRFRNIRKELDLGGAARESRRDQIETGLLFSDEVRSGTMHEESAHEESGTSRT